jgi:hypothetical protein
MGAARLRLRRVETRSCVTLAPALARSLALAIIAQAAGVRV